MIYLLSDGGSVWLKINIGYCDVTDISAAKLRVIVLDDVVNLAVKITGT